MPKLHHYYIETVKHAAWQGREPAISGVIVMRLK